MKYIVPQMSPSQVIKRLNLNISLKEFEQLLRDDRIPAQEVNGEWLIGIDTVDALYDSDFFRQNKMDD